MYLLLQNNRVVYPFSLSALGQYFPNTSFPKEVSKIDLLGYGVYKVNRTPQPIYDSLVQECKEGTPEKQDLEWVQTWVVVNKPVELAERNVRNRRNDLLSECDWTQLPDAQVDKQSWLAYRQQLRDLTTQEGFPYSVVWPVRP